MKPEKSPAEREFSIARVLRPLGDKPLSMVQAKVAAQLLGVHWTTVYRLRKRFLEDPVASSIVPKNAGPAAGGTRLDKRVDDVIDVVLSRWLPRQRELAHPRLDLTMEVRRRCRCCASQFVLVAPEIALVSVKPLRIPAPFLKLADHSQEMIEVPGRPHAARWDCLELHVVDIAPGSARIQPRPLPPRRGHVRRVQEHAGSAVVRP